MLTDDQVQRVWENMLASEVRSLYFADLASRYTRRKQWITGASFFLSSGAAAAVIGKAPNWVPATLAIVSALATAYAIAVNLDGLISTMAKLHSSWNQISADYDRLWNHTYDDDAEDQLNSIIAKEREPSEMATTNAPNKQALLGEWQQRVFASRRLDSNATAAYGN